MMGDIRAVQGRTTDGKIAVQFYFDDEFIGGYYLQRELTQEELNKWVDNLGIRMEKRIEDAILNGISQEEKTDDNSTSG